MLQLQVLIEGLELRLRGIAPGDYRLEISDLGGVLDALLPTTPAAVAGSLEVVDEIKPTAALAVRELATEHDQGRAELFAALFRAGAVASVSYQNQAPQDVQAVTARLAELGLGDAYTNGQKGGGADAATGTV